VRALARLLLPDGEVIAVWPGSLIGRSPAAVVQLDDPRVSEAHAFISMRGGDLVLLSLRRMVAVDGRPSSSVVLRPGVEVAFCEGISLRVLEVELPDEVLGLRLPDGETWVPGDVASLHAGPPLRMEGRFEPHATAHLWRVGDELRVRVGARVHTAVIGESIVLPGGSVEVVAVPLRATDLAATRQEGAIGAPLRIIAAFDTVQIHRSDRPIVTLGGRNAQLLSELAIFGGPVSWQVLAAEIWGTAESDQLRRRLDVGLSRLRTRLRAEGLRTDLVSTDGAGQVSLLLYEGDTLENLC
jgi:hypothetical protein